MAEYSRKRDAGAYFYGTEGSAALAGKPTIERRGKQAKEPARPQKPGVTPKKSSSPGERLSVKQITFTVPRWLVIVLSVALGVTVLCVLTDVTVRKATMRQEMQEQLGFLSQAERRAEELDAKLLGAADDRRGRHRLVRLPVRCGAHRRHGMADRRV
ncbi:hypothetical protein LJC74_07410 [Eubacteriales bacterium OttesenSCG-928-A19]|nr:hypothetical protein [Eubacteriales bacterium OttesenSCG-928-A19]